MATRLRSGLAILAAGAAWSGCSAPGGPELAIPHTPAPAVAAVQREHAECAAEVDVSTGTTDPVRAEGAVALRSNDDRLADVELPDRAGAHRFRLRRGDLAQSALVKELEALAADLPRPYDTLAGGAQPDLASAALELLAFLSLGSRWNDGPRRDAAEGVARAVARLVAERHASPAPAESLREHAIALMATAEWYAYTGKVQARRAAEHAAANVARQLGAEENAARREHPAIDSAWTIVALHAMRSAGLSGADAIQRRLREQTPQPSEPNASVARLVWTAFHGSEELVPVLERELTSSASDAPTPSEATFLLAIAAFRSGGDAASQWAESVLGAIARGPRAETREARRLGCLCLSAGYRFRVRAFEHE